MKLEKFLKKRPECAEYKVTVWYPMHSGRLREYENLQLNKLSTDTLTTRVVAVLHDIKRVCVVRGNV